MSSSAKSRIQLLAIIFGVIFLAHAVVIGCAVWRGRPGNKITGTTVEKLPTAESGNPGTVPQTATARPKYRYRVPSSNPRFGYGLDYSRARHGNLPERLVPGSSDARSGILIDLTSRRVIWEKNSHRPVPVASMVKMMTMLLTMEELERNSQLSLDTMVKVTDAPLRIPRTGLIYLSRGEELPLGELLLATAVKSANDAATQIADFIGPGVPNFVKKMNNRALGMGLRDTRFLNPCGLPERDKRNSLSSAHDMVLIGERLLEYPNILKYSQTQSAKVRNGKTVIVNTNKLINPHYPGVEGLKTGYTRAAGSCLTFVVTRHGRRLMGCVTGFRGSKNRDRFCRRLIDWAYGDKPPMSRRARRR